MLIPIKLRRFLSITLIAIMLSATAALGQTAPSPNPQTIQRSNLPETNFVERFLPGSSDDIAARAVHLDGYRLFSITAQVVPSKNRDFGVPSPIKQRVRIIENRLQAFAKSESVTVTQQADTATGLPVLYVNDQELMTVTNQDALLYSSTPEPWASELVPLIRAALLRTQRERQPAFLRRQTVWAFAIGLFMLVSSLLITWRQRCLKARQLLNGEVQAEETEQGAIATQTDPKQIQHQRNIQRLKLLLLQMGKYALLAVGSFRILGLFPQTRWLQVAILTGARVPFRLLGIGLLTYLFIRVSFILIDRLCAAFRQQSFLLSAKSKRSTLRIATVARVLHGVSVVVLVSVGILGMLAVLGIDLVPLLAGVSVIGLAVSFASQSLIKDAINGFFILLEDQYGVGDVIVIGSVSGLVEHMNLRITQLRDSEGRLITVPNSMVDIVQNLSKDWSRVDLSIDVTYLADPEQALTAVEQVAMELYQDRVWHSEILEPPDVLGIENLNHNGMTIRTWIKTVPLSQWKVSREFRRRLKLQLDEADIAIGMPQQVITTQHDMMAPKPNKI